MGEQDAVAQETAARLSAELSVNGFDLASAEQRLDHTADAELEVVGGARPEVRVRLNREAEAKALWRVSLPGAPRQRVAALLALRTVELLQARSAQLRERERQSTAERHASAGSARPLRLRASLGGFAALPAGALAAGGLGIGFRFTPSFDLSLSGFMSLSSLELASPAGAAQLTVGVAGVEPHFIVAVTNAWELRSGALVGAALVSGESSAVQPAQAHDARIAAFSVGPLLSVYRGWQGWALGLEARLLILAPSPLFILEQKQTRFGRPLTAIVVTMEFQP